MPELMSSSGVSLTFEAMTESPSKPLPDQMDLAAIEYCNEEESVHVLLCASVLNCYILETERSGLYTSSEPLDAF
jgi:hypothetical protein